MVAMTEAEAKNKWCPFARQSDENTGAFNRLSAYQVRLPDENGDIKKDPTVTIGIRYRYEKIAAGKPAEGCLCIASACMAWKLTPVNVQGEFGYCGLVHQ